MWFCFVLFFFLNLHLSIPLRAETPHYRVIISSGHWGRRWLHPLWEQPLKSWLHFLSDSSGSTMDSLIHQGFHVVARAEWVHAVLGALLSSKPQLAAAAATAVDAAIKNFSAHAEIAFLLISHPALPKRGCRHVHLQLCMYWRTWHSSGTLWDLG